MASNQQTCVEAAGSLVRGIGLAGARLSREESLQPEQECCGVRVSLENHSMWREFCRCQTEMVVTPQGSRMFPYCRFTIAGLHPSRNYSLQLELRLSHSSRFKWTGTRWEDSGPAQTQVKVRARPFTHPDSPAPGRHWMESPVSFYRLKLTQGVVPQEGTAALMLKHRYLPTLLVLPADQELDAALTFSFAQTEFMAVSSYHNKELTQLKSLYNPFSKGCAALRSPIQTDVAPPLPMKSLKSLLNNHRVRNCNAEKPRAPSPRSLSSPARPHKLFSELIREAHVSLHRCNLDHLGLTNPISQPPVAGMPEAQEVLCSDRTVNVLKPSKAEGSEVKGSSSEASTEASSKQHRRPARLPLPALALFLKRHSAKQKPPEALLTGCPPSQDTQQEVQCSGARPETETVDVAQSFFDPADPSRTLESPNVSGLSSKHPPASLPVALSPPAGPPPSSSTRSQPLRKCSDCAAQLPNPECSSLGFEPLSPATSPEPLPSLPASLTFDLEDSVGPQAASSVFQWHTVLPLQNQLMDETLPTSQVTPPTPLLPESRPHLQLPAELSPLVLPLSPSFSLDGDGLSPTSSLADLVHLFSNTDDFSSADLTNDQPAGAELAIGNLSADDFTTCSHSNNNSSVTNDNKGAVDSLSDDVMDVDFSLGRLSAINHLSYKHIVNKEEVKPTNNSILDNNTTVHLLNNDFIANNCTDTGVNGSRPDEDFTPRGLSSSTPGNHLSPDDLLSSLTDGDVSVHPPAGDALITRALTNESVVSAELTAGGETLSSPRKESPCRAMQPSLEEVEEQLFVSFTTKEALKLHTSDSSEEVQPLDAEEWTKHESPQQNIQTFQSLLLGDLRLMKHRQVIHPVLQEVGLKMNLLDSKSAVDLQYLGVQLPIPPPGLGAGAGSQTPSAAFVSRTGKASALTQIKGWRDKFSPSEAPPPAANCSAEVLPEPQKKKNLSAFCSDMLDEYLESEGKLIDQQVCSFSQPADHPLLYSCNFVPAPGPASQLFSTFIPPSKRPRVPEIKRRGRKPQKPKAERGPQPMGRGRKKRKHSVFPAEAPPPTEPPTNDLAPLESDSELGPGSDAEGQRVDHRPSQIPPLTVPPSNDLAYLESRPSAHSSKTPPPHQRAMLRQKDLEDAALWDGHARTTVTEGRASVALTSLFTLKGFVREDPLAPVQMECRRPPRCLNTFCRLGCVCDSLNALRRPAHCARSSCMFSCSCLKQKVVLLRNLDSPLQYNHRRRRRKRRRMKMAYILKDSDCVSPPPPRLRMLWTTAGAADPEPLHVPQVLPALQVTQRETSSCARVRTFTCSKGATDAVQGEVRKTKPVKRSRPYEKHSGSASDLLSPRRLLVRSDCEWKNECERSDVLQQLCEALTSQPPRRTLWIKDYLVQVCPPSSESSHLQYSAHITRPQRPGTPEEACILGAELVTEQLGAKPAPEEVFGFWERRRRRRRRMKNPALPFLTGISPAGFLSANRREVGGTKQLIEVNGKLYPLAKIQLGMMGALHPANRLAAYLTGRVGSMHSTPSPQHIPPTQVPPTDTVNIDNDDVMHSEDDVMSWDDDAVVSMDTESELDGKIQRHNFQAKQRRQQLSQQFDLLRREIGLDDTKSARVLILNKAKQLIGHLQEEEAELKSKKQRLKKHHEQKLALLSSEEGAEQEQRSSEVTPDTKDTHPANQLPGGGGASEHKETSHDLPIIPQAQPPLVLSPPTSSPVQVLFKLKPTRPNILLHNRPLNKNCGDGESAQEPSKVPLLFPRQPVLTISHLTTGQLVLQSANHKGLTEVTLNVPKPTNQKLHLVSLSHPHTATSKNLEVQCPLQTQQQLKETQKQQHTQMQPKSSTNMKLVKVYFPPQIQSKQQIHQVHQQTENQGQQTNTKVIKLHYEPQTQAIHTKQQTQHKPVLLQNTQTHTLTQTQSQHLTQQIIQLVQQQQQQQQCKQPQQMSQTHQLVLHPQHSPPPGSCDTPTNGWMAASGENLQSLLSELGFDNQLAMPTAEAPPTETPVGLVTKRTEEVELNALNHTHLDSKAPPPLMQMKVGVKLSDMPTSGTESQLGAGVQAGAWRPMPRLLKGNPPT